MVVSFMAFPPASSDLEDKYETFDETADPYSIGQRVNGSMMVGDVSPEIRYSLPTPKRLYPMRTTG